MKSYVLRRLLALVPTLILASIIVFVTVRLIPGDIIELMLSQNDLSADAKSREQVVAALGLDKPMWQQYLTWISGIVLHGDLGKSLWQGTPVTEQLLARMPVTFELGAIALLVGLIIALPIGIYSAIRQDTAGDYIARSFSILLLAVPSFWLGTMVALGRLHPLQQGSGRKRQEPAAARCGAGGGAVCHHDANDPHHDARSTAPGLHPNRLGQGPDRKAGDRASRASQCADPGGDAGRAAGAAADWWCGHHRTDLHHSRHGAAAARSRAKA
jgi:hypothetical protein